MQYYKVKPTSDQVRTRILWKNQILVANEVYTAKEIQRAQQAGFITAEFIAKHFNVFEVRKKQTFTFFGARFFYPNAEILPV